MLTINQIGFILIALPLFPLMLAILLESDKKIRLQEIIFFVAVIVCLFFSYQYVQIQRMKTITGDDNLYSFAEIFLQWFFGSFSFPSIYLFGLLLFYFGVYKSVRRRVQKGGFFRD
jgi:hypothetical protein